MPHSTKIKGCISCLQINDITRKKKNISFSGLKMYVMSTGQETGDTRPQGPGFLLGRTGLIGKNKDSEVRYLDRTLKFSFCAALDKLLNLSVP